MSEIEIIAGVVERVGTWAVFLWLFLRESTMRREATEHHVADLRDLALRLNGRSRNEPKM